MFFRKSTSFFIAILLVVISMPTVSNARSFETVIRTQDASSVGERVERPLRPERGASLFVEDEIIVKMKDADAPIRVRNEERKNIRDFVREYQNNENVEYAEPNYIAYAYAVPNDPRYSSQWNFDNAQYGGVHASAAWDVVQGQGQGVVIAIIDTGVAYENYGTGLSGYYQAPDLAGTTFVQGYDFVNKDTHPNDDEGHGTHVAGTIAQTTNNGVGVAGLAYKASIMPIKVLNSNGSGTYADIVAAIRYAADNGAKVISMSLGGPSSSIALQDAITYAYGKGVTIVAASGNDGGNVTSYPAAYPQVISVGATRYDETRAPYSNYGATLDIVAPGGDTTVDQNNDGYGDGILQQTFGNSRSTFNYYFYQGTSMATPHVAAAAAMVIGKGIATTPDAVRNVLLSTADDLGASGRDDIYGFGLLNVAAALGATVVQPPVVDTKPTTQITSPSSAASVSGTVVITANANDDVAVSLVDFSIDGTLKETDTSSPYSTSWNTTGVPNGLHTIGVVARDSIGQIATSSISVTVNNVVVPPPQPTTVTVFSDSFESGLGKWTQDSQKDWSQSSQRATNGSRSAEVDGGASNSSITTTVNLQGKTNAVISYAWLIENSLDTGEYLAFDVSTNGGTVWQNLASLNGDQNVEDVWQNKQHTLTGISSLKLRLRGTMSQSSEDANVDNVVVTAY